MFYIEYVEKESLNYKNRLLSNIMYLYKKYIKKIEVQYLGNLQTKYGTNVDNLSQKIKINIYNVNKKVLKKLDNIINIILEENVVLSQNLMTETNNEKYDEIISYLNNKGINVLSGDKIFKILFIKELEKIQELSGLDNNIRIGILIDTIDSDFIYNLESIALKYKEVVILTKYENRLEKIKNKLYTENGIIININNKSLFLKSDIIVNYDYGEKICNDNSNNKTNDKIDNIILGKCIFLNYSKIKNLDELKIKLLDGIIINDFELEFKNKEIIIEEYKEYFDKLQNFDFNYVYESLILKKTKISNMIDNIERDDVYIKNFIGTKRCILKNEFVSYGNYVSSNKRVISGRRKIK